MNDLPIRCLRRLAMSGRPTVTMAASATSFLGARAASTFKRFHRPNMELTKFPDGHGEQIWIFDNIATNQVVYSHTPILRNNRALRQLPFNGKQTKPVKLRKDYWRPLALIQFDAGAGVVGRSVFQKLREFRRLHELSWGHQASDLYAMDRKARGAALCDQRANSIADMAAVLAGAGHGNRIRLSADKDQAAASTAPATLTEATVFWANDADIQTAESWSKNVVHVAGIPTLKAAPETVETA
ncbi:hypothetical protein CMQ_7150 [Grosmannia clavigera kw1407]|uniref:Large ribosomal subunit protein mL67 n=1 Tax=Grosmannia clavigera (strain kw1407 / UAMH 11150) TaxID=655863 RepID=F0XQK6_GROCL|nr:uncharacterized protein CMQ_7150 [Grosmannia clavigera kw1407]EFX00148.1 hypothetical protein CMQ_7150 [Grosmannia clavigera kw1407]